MTCFQLDDVFYSFSDKVYIADVGEFEEFNVNRMKYCYVSADRPVLVIQYAYGRSANNDWGDPFMMMIIPTEQYITNTTISFYAFENFNSDITIVVLQQAAPTSGNVLLDNVSVGSEWTQLHCSEEELCGYTLRMQVSSGFHTLKHFNNSVPVAVYVYGFERYRSYGYPAAMTLRG